VCGDNAVGLPWGSGKSGGKELALGVSYQDMDNVLVSAVDSVNVFVSEEE
jgi:hypothetical protein